jgi:hypothetical protein
MNKDDVDFYSNKYPYDRDFVKEIEDQLIDVTSLIPEHNTNIVDIDPETCNHAWYSLHNNMTYKITGRRCSKCKLQEGY